MIIRPVADRYQPTDDLVDDVLAVLARHGHPAVDESASCSAAVLLGDVIDAAEGRITSNYRLRPAKDGAS